MELIFGGSILAICMYVCMYVCISICIYILYGDPRSVSSIPAIYIVTNSQVLFHDGTFITLNVQYTTLDYSSQLFWNSNTRITSTSSLTQLTNYTAGKYTSYLFAFQHLTVDYSSSITHVRTVQVLSQLF
jgi:hypothetical protein